MYFETDHVPEHQLEQNSANRFFHMLPPFGHSLLVQLLDSVIGTTIKFIIRIIFGLMSFCHLAVVRLS